MNYLQKILLLDQNNSNGLILISYTSRTNRNNNNTLIKIISHNFPQNTNTIQILCFQNCKIKKIKEFKTTMKI